MASNNYSYQNTAANTPTPYGSGDPYYNESSGFITPQHPKKGTSPWIKFGIPVLIAVIIAAVLGGVLGSRAHNNSSSSSAAAASASPTGAAAASQAASIKEAIGVFPTSTNSLYMAPLYPATTNQAAYSNPTFQPVAAGVSWPSDTFQPSNPSPTQVRQDRPRIIAPSYKWEALPQLIQNEPYMKYWNTSIFQNATDYFSEPPVPYYLDSGNGILDIARQIKMRVKAFSYAYRMTNESKWAERAWDELLNAAGNGSSSFGPDTTEKWNPTHFLDTAEMINAYAIAYDWMYDYWNQTQKDDIIWTMITYGLEPGVVGYSNSNGLYYGWWTNETQGNWNCVCNSGLTIGALAILGDDNSGIAEQLLALTIPNALLNCVQAVSSDGTWSETPNYWYFGVTGHAEMSSALLTATGSDQGILTANPAYAKTGLFHMYGEGPASTFSYGDNGVNLYSTTANAMLLYGDHFNHAEYVLFQRDRFDVVEPYSMFWYNPSVSGAFWDGMPLDHYFDNTTDQWVSMRSSWTDEDALYVAMKGGTLQGHQAHNDLDAGDFVLDAMGTRWFGELGDDNYLNAFYFSNDSQDSARWLYYRKRSEGQNVIIVNADNQLVTADPVAEFDTSGDAQGSSTVYTPSSNSTAYFTLDLGSAYAQTTSYTRGVRMINSRRQVLLQDDITASASVMWRGHTNATNIDIDSSGTSATLQIGNEKMVMQILNPPSGATITTTQAVRLSTDPPIPAGATELPNVGVTVVVISLPAGTYSLQVLFSPQWADMSASAYQTPPSVPLSSWSLTSHDS